jgi:hypothetical protein
LSAEIKASPSPEKGNLGISGARLSRVAWDQHAEREERRYADALARLPDETDLRQKQLVRAAMAAGGAGLARMMQGRRAEAAGWFARSAERYRDSWPEAPPGSWGRLIGALKARVLAGDWEGAETDARWALEQDPAGGDSPIGAYAAALAQLILGEDAAAAELGARLRATGDDAFPAPVAEALAGLAEGDGELYAAGCSAVLASFESREAYLEDIPVADTVVVLEALAERRGMAVGPSSALLP